jgi:hypothetical protein
VVLVHVTSSLFHPSYFITGGDCCIPVCRLYSVPESAFESGARDVDEDDADEGDQGTM